MCPHCRAKDHLQLWIPTPKILQTGDPPIDSDHHTSTIFKEHLNCVLDIIATLWTEKTKETYGAGLLVFHVYCDLNHISEPLRCPISQPLLSAFLASCAGAYSGATLSNFVAGLHAWHILHSQPWITNHNELRAILKGASRLAPTTSKCPKCIPFERNDLLHFLTYLNLHTPCDTAIFACIVTTFYSISCLSKFTVPSLKKFSPTVHITPSHLSRVKDRNRLEVLALHLLKTKCSPNGENTQCTPIPHLTNPVKHIDNHLQINTPGSNNHLFAWRHPKGLHPL